MFDSGIMYRFFCWMYINYYMQKVVCTFCIWFNEEGGNLFHKKIGIWCIIKLNFECYAPVNSLKSLN
jgi:hypothetical protein